MKEVTDWDIEITLKMNNNIFEKSTLHLMLTMTTKEIIKKLRSDRSQDFQKLIHSMRISISMALTITKTNMKKAKL